MLHSSVKYSSEPRILPNGYTIQIKDRSKEINKRIENITKYGFHGYIKAIRINLEFITERSRLLLFSYRVRYKIYQKILKFNNKNKNINLNDINENNKNRIFRYYYSEKFITSDERKNIVNGYKKTIFDIIERLNPNQKLILSTVMSDNLFPPFADVIDNHDLGQLENYEKYAKKSYEALLNDDYSSLDFFVKKIPPGANKSYLQAENCLGLVWDNKLINSNCLDLFQEARKLDNFPIRVVPEINAFIRELKFNNVIIIDPVKILNNSNNFINYKNHFADFQHPSALGHYLIANEILIKLFDDYSAPLSFSLNECDHLVIQKKFKKFIIKPNNSTQRWSINRSIKWLDDFINKQPGYRDFYNYYKDKTINKRDFCDIKS